MSAAKPPRFGRSLKPFRRPWLWASLWVLAVAAVVVASLMPASDLPHVPNNFDKIEHFIAYAGLSAGAVQLFVRRLSWGFVCVLLVLIVELINSAIEATVDRISLDHHPLAKRAKDIGSAAVMIALLNAVLVWALVLSA